MLSWRQVTLPDLLVAATSLCWLVLGHLLGHLLVTCHHTDFVVGIHQATCIQLMIKGMSAGTWQGPGGA